MHRYGAPQTTNMICPEWRLGRIVIGHETPIEKSSNLIERYQRYYPPCNPGLHLRNAFVRLIGTVSEGLGLGKQIF